MKTCSYARDVGFDSREGGDMNEAVPIFPTDVDDVSDKGELRKKLGGMLMC